jgi:hypothetical protein
MLIISLLATRGKNTNEFRHHLGARRVVDIPFLAAALHQTGATQDVEMVRKRRPRNLKLSLDVSSGHFRPSLNEKEEDLQARLMRERLECLDMRVAGLESVNRQRLHASKYTEISNASQVLVFTIPDHAACRLVAISVRTKTAAQIATRPPKPSTTKAHPHAIRAPASALT